MLIKIILFILFAVPVIAQERWISPIYNPKDPLLWNISKDLGYVAGSMDAYSTTSALRRGYVEKNIIDNLFMDHHSPAPAGRMISSFAIQYAFNFALDYAWHHKSSTKKEKILLLITRTGLTGMSIWAFNHNNNLK
jgi:hypothetical protein